MRYLVWGITFALLGNDMRFAFVLFFCLTAILACNRQAERVANKKYENERFADGKNPGGSVDNGVERTGGGGDDHLSVPRAEAIARMLRNIRLDVAWAINTLLNTSSPASVGMAAHEYFKLMPMLTDPRRHILDIVNSAKIEIRTNAPCVHDKKEYAGSAKVRSLSICISIVGASASIKDEKAAMPALVGLATHEFSHLAGLDEANAQILQAWVRRSVSAKTDLALDDFSLGYQLMNFFFIVEARKKSDLDLIGQSGGDKKRYQDFCEEDARRGEYLLALLETITKKLEELRELHGYSPLFYPESLKKELLGRALSRAEDYSDFKNGKLTWGYKQGESYEKVIGLFEDLHLLHYTYVNPARLFLFECKNSNGPIASDLKRELEARIEWTDWLIKSYDLPLFYYFWSERGPQEPTLCSTGKVASVLPKVTFPDILHPSGLGFREWYGQEVRKYSERGIKKMEFVRKTISESE